MMWLFNAPPAVLGLLALTCLPTAIAKPYPAHVAELEQFHNSSQIVERAECASGITCGYYGQLCCPSGSKCDVNAANEAICGAGGEAATTAAGGYWQYQTSTWVETVGLATYTSVWSTYVPAAVATPASCSDSQQACGSTKCCDSGFYCLNSLDGTCALIAGGSSGGIAPTGTLTPSAPLRPTSSGVVVVTYTGTPTATVAFETPVPTGAAGGGLVPTEESSGGLSGGAIAGIVIGVILGILLLLLLCLFCCARALFDTIAAIFGFGKKRKHTHEETYIEEHHHSGGGAAAASGGGRWYGAGRPARPSRVGSEKTSGAKKGLGLAAGLGGLALALGLKRRHDAKHDDKSTTVSGTSYMYSDYTSSSKSLRRVRNVRMEC
jgi:hypothetical protein